MGFVIKAVLKHSVICLTSMHTFCWGSYGRPGMWSLIERTMEGIGRYLNKHYTIFDDTKENWDRLKLSGVVNLHKLKAMKLIKRPIRKYLLVLCQTINWCQNWGLEKKAFNLTLTSNDFSERKLHCQENKTADTSLSKTLIFRTYLLLVLLIMGVFLSSHTSEACYKGITCADQPHNNAGNEQPQIWHCCLAGWFLSLHPRL